MTESFGAADLVLAAAADDPPWDLPDRLCAALCEGLPVDAATISLYTDAPDRQLLHASNEAALQLEEIQFELGEGPCVTAAATGRPVIVPDLHGRLTEWPLFGATARQRLPDIGSVYAFPMVDGPHHVGAVDLLRKDAWDPDEQTVRKASLAVRATAVALLTIPDDLPWEPTEVMDAHWGRTHRTAGVMAQRLGISVDEALARLRAEAFGSGRPLPEVSDAILARLGVPGSCGDST